VPGRLQTGAAWSWRLLLVAAAIYLVVRVLLTEFVISVVLMVVIMATSVFKRAPGRGATFGVAYRPVGRRRDLGLPAPGGSLNPPRILGPDIVAVQFPLWWVYFVGPIAGAALWKFAVAKGRQ
jgi:glycerol uptake facilitator-like aquaporin